MFEKEQQLIEEKIKEYCAANDITLAELKWQPIPFSGEWGTSTSFFQTAANEARAGSGNPAKASGTTARSRCRKEPRKSRSRSRASFD